MERHAARWAGALALVLVVVGPVALLVVPGATVVPGDLLATAELQRSQAGLVRLGILAELLIVLVEIGMAGALQSVFEREQPGLARLVGQSRLTMAVLQGVAALLGLGACAVFLDGEAALGGSLLATKTAAVFIWQGVFALHCAVLALSLTRASRFPRLLGPLMGLTALGYGVVSLGGIFAPELHLEQNPLLTLMLMGELPTFLYLLVRAPAQ